MSRSYRKPYAAVTGSNSAKEDKVRAARGVRRAQNRSVFGVTDWDGYLTPHRLECSYNNTYVWSRDGGKLYYGRPNDSTAEWCREWYVRIQRK